MISSVIKEILGPVFLILSRNSRMLGNGGHVHFVIVPPDNVDIRRDSPQIVICFFVAHISCAYYLLYLPRELA